LVEHDAAGSAKRLAGKKAKAAMIQCRRYINASMSNSWM
jgi:hypothetical protein